MIAIRYTDRGNRSINEYQWTAENGYVCKVPAELAASLLTYPYGGFELASKPNKTDQKALNNELGIDEVTDGK